MTASQTNSGWALAKLPGSKMSDQVPPALSVASTSGLKSRPFWPAFFGAIGGISMYASACSTWMARSRE